MSRAAFCCLTMLLMPAMPGVASGQAVRLDAVPPARAPADFRMTRAEFQEPGLTQRRGLIGSVDLGQGLQLGIGRFSVPELARPSLHTERVTRPADVRHRDQGIAAVGFSYSF